MPRPQAVIWLLSSVIRPLSSDFCFCPLTSVICSLTPDT